MVSDGQGLGASGFDPARVMLDADCTGDETLWVCRYWSHFKRISGCDPAEAIVHANAAYEMWGHDPDCTPEEVASSDYAIAIEVAKPARRKAARPKAKARAESIAQTQSETGK